MSTFKKRILITIPIEVDLIIDFDELSQGGDIELDQHLKDVTGTINNQLSIAVEAIKKDLPKEMKSITRVGGATVTTSEMISC